MFDFKDHSFQLTDYTIKSDGNNANHLQSWVIEGSNDLINWDSIDKRTTKDLCSNFAVKSYHCNLQKYKDYRCIRLRQTGKNSNFLDYLMIANIEFFGMLSFAGQKKKKK